MTVTISNTYFYSSGAISFSSLRTNFKQTDTGSISASELRRNTSTSSSNPIVPDATENSSITTSNNWKTSQFRNSIKYYNITQTDTNLNFNIGNSAFWNGNLTRNVNKRVYINGTCGSNLTSTPAASLTSLLVYNIFITVSGGIYGAAGSGGTSSAISGGSGGDALLINPGSSSSNIVVQVNSTANIYGGGGGGEFGTTGATGATGICILENTQEVFACRNCPGDCTGYTVPKEITGTGYYQQINNFLGGCRDSSRCGCGAFGCAARKAGDCRADYYYYVGGGPGGVGGNGAKGRGYDNFSASLSGSAGSAGSGGGCAGYSRNGSPVPQPGQTGETGGSGGNWGSAGGNTNNTGSGGFAGRAINGSKYLVSGTISSITIKGSYLP